MKPKKKRVYDWCPDQSIVTTKERKVVRCPSCNRRLLPQEICQPIEFFPDEYQCGEKEVIGFKLPPHKTYKLEKIIRKKIKRLDIV